MTGFILFQNAVLRVIRHLDEALAVSGLIWIGILVVQILAFGAIDMEALATGDPTAVSGGGLWLILLSNVVMAVGSCWIAVEWHLYALEGKRPTSAFPSWSGSRVWGYLGLSIVIGLIIGVLAGMFLALLGGILAQTLGMLFVVAVIGVPAIFFFFRISPSLPAVALGQKLSFADAWQATKPHSVVIFQAVILSIALLILVQIVSLVFGSGLLGLLYELLTGWFLLMVNVSLLSSIYELAVRGALDD